MEITEVKIMKAVAAAAVSAAILSACGHAAAFPAAGHHKHVHWHISQSPSPAGSPSPAASVTSAVAVTCVPYTKLSAPTSLGQWYRQTGINPAIELDVVTKCDGLQGGWTWCVANLLMGQYGPDLWTAKLPAGCKLWKQL